jgi:hypothetical protein
MANVLTGRRIQFMPVGQSHSLSHHVQVRFYDFRDKARDERLAQAEKLFVWRVIRSLSLLGLLLSPYLLG